MARRPFPCLGGSYLSWGECKSDDVPWTVTIECDSTSGCGWSVDVTDRMGLDDGEFSYLHEQHIEHRNSLYDAQEGT